MFLRIMCSLSFVRSIVHRHDVIDHFHSHHAMLQARHYTEAALEWDPECPQANRLMGFVRYVDGFHNTARRLLHRYSVDSEQERINIEQCVSDMKAIIGDCCVKVYSKSLQRQVDLKCDGLSTILAVSAVAMISRLTPSTLSSTEDANLTFKDLLAMRAPSTKIHPFYVKARNLESSLTLNPSAYVETSDTQSNSLLRMIIASKSHGTASSAPRLVVGSWNMQATYNVHGPSAVGFLSTKLENLAVVAKEHSMALIALQECPGLATHTRETLFDLTDGGSTKSSFSDWKYCEAQTGEEGSGFLYDKSVLQLVAEPVTFLNTTPYRSDGPNPDAFKRPPVLAIFKGAARSRGLADLAAQRVGLIAVVNVHLKSSSDGTPDLPQADVRLLGHHRLQAWIDEQLSKAEREPLIGSHTFRSRGNSCTLIIGDFNLSGQYKSSQHLLPKVEKNTYPGTAWDDLEVQYKRLLHAGDFTNLGPPWTKTRCAYDNALVRYLPSMESAGRKPRAAVCAMKEAAVNLFQMRADINKAWSDHLPIVAYL